MDTLQKLNSLSQKIQDQGGVILTEEATKNAFIMPFISMVLGYDVFDPREVLPEYTTDIGTKKGEKIDYAILKDGKIQILVECKKYKEILNLNHASQLFRYFAVSNARIAILTNGQIYQFFTDLDAPNKMDERPFLELDLLNLDEHLIPELKKLTKSAFDIDSVISAAEGLKYLNQIKKIIAKQIHEPDSDFITFFARQVYAAGPITQKIRDQFSDLLKRAFAQFLSDQINDRLKTALSSGAPEPLQQVDAIQIDSGKEENDGGVVTTDEELEGFRVVRAILRSVIDVKRVVYRDAQSYCAILLDDNNRKTICRLHFNRSQKYIGFLGDDRKETRSPINSLDDLYGFADQLRAVIAAYETGKRD